MNQAKLPLTSFGSLLAAVFVAGCASPGKLVSNGAWNAFETAGPTHNRFYVQDSRTVTPDIFARLGILAVVAATNDPEVRIKAPLTGCKAAWNGAKLWLFWERPGSARRLSRGQPALETPVSLWAEGLAQSCLSGAAEGAAPMLVMAYAMYMPVGGIIGAISGAAGCPSREELPQLLDVATNTLVAAWTQHPLASEFLTQLQENDRDVTTHPELAIGHGPAAADSTLEVAIFSIRLEGGRNPNASLWLTVEWSACLSRAGSPAPDYWLRGVWQSDKTQTLVMWAVDGGSPLDDAMKEACRQIAAAAIEHMMPCEDQASGLTRDAGGLAGKSAPQRHPYRLSSPRGEP